MKTKHKPFSYESAKKRAVANAAYFNQPYMVFSDTCGNWRCERDNPRALHNRETVNPPGKSGKLSFA